MVKNGKTSHQTGEQFGRQAAHYAVSTGIHAHSEGLDALEAFVSSRTYNVAVDLATGAGFTAFALAPYADHIFATDIAHGMLTQAGNLAKERKLNNIEFAFVEAEQMPFRDGSLDMVSCRQAAHHFYDLPKALIEISRVLRTGGDFLLSDSCAPEPEQVADWMNDMQLRRDFTHVKDRKVTEWYTMLGDVGLEVVDCKMTRVNLEFNDWVRRSATPVEKLAALREDFMTADEDIRDIFQITAKDSDIFFNWPVIVLKATK
ncbi:MAG: Ubiquinone/menaquinone biosynthesis C-methylase UbiE [Chloroflexi bacterium]|jgi:ubiquinone/menaquinone biosynthesis C-methylase UbiE|nr:MAG: Ubiquinone/menaquinone biosynthesis C-methylase UbiE [Chloroflexota bacterium]